PSGAPGPGLMPSDRRGGDTQEGTSVWEQVLVAAFPNQIPEVHVASLDPQKGVLTLREASVAGAGDVSLGTEHRVDLAQAGSVVTSDGVVAVLGHDGELMVQMHLETEEEQQSWTKGLELIIQDRSTGVRASPKKSSVPASPSAIMRQQVAADAEGD
ncbi:unnamed protein product, partial [Polarella glacialis]